MKSLLLLCVLFLCLGYCVGELWPPSEALEAASRPIPSSWLEFFDKQTHADYVNPVLVGSVGTDDSTLTNQNDHPSSSSPPDSPSSLSFSSFPLPPSSAQKYCPGKLQWFSFFNATTISLFLMGWVALILLQMVSAPSGTTSPKLEKQESNPTILLPSLFSALVGSGTQFVFAFFTTLFLIQIGMAQTEREVLTSFVILFFFSGLPGGYRAAKVYHAVTGTKHGASLVFWTALLIPGLIFLVFFLLFLTLKFLPLIMQKMGMEELIEREREQGNVAFSPTTLLLYFLLWFGISIPCTIIGAEFAPRNLIKAREFLDFDWFPSRESKRQDVEEEKGEKGGEKGEERGEEKTAEKEKLLDGAYVLPVGDLSDTNAKTPSEWRKVGDRIILWSFVLVGSIYPFNVCLTQVFLFLSSFFLGASHLFGFGVFCGVLFFVLIACVCISIIICYDCLLVKDSQWQWKSFLSSALSSLWLFSYLITFLLQNRSQFGLDDQILFFGFSVIVGLCFFVTTGSVGFLGVLWFLRAVRKERKKREREIALSLVQMV